MLVRPFHFRQTQRSHSNRSVVCIGTSARGGKMNEGQENEALKDPVILTIHAFLTRPGFGFRAALNPRLVL